VPVIATTIRGFPYSQAKSRGDLEAPGRWTAAIIETTKDLPPVSEACFLKLTFLLPENKFPKDFPYGPDIDNLLKRTLDALQQTVFRNAPGRDSCVIAMFAMKTKVASHDEAGVHMEILPVSLTSGTVEATTTETARKG
jgi:Holliday junction resolvase RusA-like endonuclease